MDNVFFPFFPLVGVNEIHSAALSFDSDAVQSPPAVKLTDAVPPSGVNTGFTFSDAATTSSGTSFCGSE